jgi:hypothetical protein
LCYCGFCWSKEPCNLNHQEDNRTKSLFWIYVTMATSKFQKGPDLKRFMVRSNWPFCFLQAMTDRHILSFLAGLLLTHTLLLSVSVSVSAQLRTNASVCLSMVTEEWLEPFVVMMPF